jgi:hypothetical protein
MNTDRRREERLEQKSDVTWTVSASGLSGDAMLLDISAGGACIRVRQSTPLTAGVAISLTCDRLPLPSSGRILWSRSVGDATVLCGIEFPADRAWTAWIAAHDRTPDFA